MGRVTTEATIYNVHDLEEAESGKLPPDQVRKVVVADALVDTGATTLSMPAALIQQLGLKKRYEKRAMTGAGLRMFDVHGTARLVIMGREIPTDVIALPEGNTVLIGQLPLEMMDWVVDLRNKKLIGNPEHGGEHILELL